MRTELESREGGAVAEAGRLYYLDWLRVLAILMVFLFHAVHPFDFGDWQVKNVEQSEIISIVLLLLGIWGMPFFFMVAGAASWFALQRRSAAQYLRERFNRLLIPFIIWTILFSPMEMYLEWANKVQREVVTGSFQDFVVGPFTGRSFLSLITPRWFGYGFHLWFLGFLFSFALITLPLFGWLKKGTGRRLVAWLARLSEHRGGILVFILPLAIVQSLLEPLYPVEHDWADFIVQMSFFILGFILFADQTFIQSIRRDWRLLLGLPTVIVVGLVGLYLADLPVLEWSETPDLPQFYVLQFLGITISFCYSLGMLFIGVRFLDFTNRWLRYGQEAALPFFVLHQPVIIVIAFYVVQWETSIWIKLPIVVVSSFAISVCVYEVIVRRIRPLRRVFGMKAPGPIKA